MSYNFKQVMSEHSDEKLLKIIGPERKNYQPEAIEAAEAELAARDINSDVIATAISNASAQSVQSEQTSIKISTSFKLLRFVNLVVDYFIVYLLIAIFTFVFSSFITTAAWLSLINVRVLYAFLGVSILAIYICYYYFMELKFGKTIGKFVTKTHIESVHKAQPSKGDILARSFLRLLPFEAIWYLFSNECWHDSLSDTKVAKDKPLPPTETANI